MMYDWETSRMTAWSNTVFYRWDHDLQTAIHMEPITWCHKNQSSWLHQCMHMVWMKLWQPLLHTLSHFVLLSKSLDTHKYKHLIIRITKDTKDTLSSYYNPVQVSIHNMAKIKACLFLPYLLWGGLYGTSFASCIHPSQCVFVWCVVTFGKIGGFFANMGFTGSYSMGVSILKRRI